MGVVALVFLGFMAFKAPVTVQVAQPGFGAATITNGSGALDQQALLTKLGLIAGPVAAIEQTSTAAIDFPSLVATSSQATTTAIGIAASLGDAVLVYPNTSSTGVEFVGHVQVASTTSATIQISEFTTGGATVDVTSTSYSVTVLPKATFVAPTGL